MSSDDDLQANNERIDVETSDQELAPAERSHEPFNWKLLNPPPTQRRAAVNRRAVSDEARPVGATAPPQDCVAARMADVVPLSAPTYSLPADSVVPVAEATYSLPSAEHGSAGFKDVSPEGNIGGGSDLITQLPAFDPGWNDVQQAIYKYLANIAPLTIKKSAQRFVRYVIVGERNYIPSTRAARRSFESALRVGAMLNALHPNDAIATGWTNRCACRNFPAPQAPLIAIELEGGDLLFECKAFEPREGRRQRLRKLPNGWFNESLRKPDNVAPRLRAGLLILALSGCRTCEIAQSRADYDDASGSITLIIPNAKQQDSNRKGSFRHMTFRITGDYGSLVRELIQLYAGDLDIVKDVSAKALQNLLARISKKIFPSVSPGLNSYCYRNLFIADLKKDGVPREKIAYLIGHTSSKTASMYGTWAQGRKGRRVCLQIPSDSNIDQYAENSHVSRPRLRN